MKKRKRGASNSHDPLRQQLKNVCLLAASVSFRAHLNKRETPPKRISPLHHRPPPTTPSPVSATKRPFPPVWPMIWSCGARAAREGAEGSPQRTERTSVLSDVHTWIKKRKAISEVLFYSVLHPVVQKKWPKMAMFCVARPKKQHKSQQNNKAVKTINLKPISGN